jgi:hypothetical protein
VKRDDRIIVLSTIAAGVIGLLLATAIVDRL